MTLLFLVLLGMSPMQGTSPVAVAMGHYPGWRGCPIEFDIAANWVAERVEPDAGRDEQCAVEVKPSDLEERLATNDIDVYTIRVSLLRPSRFLDVAQKYFTFRHGRWYIEGRSGVLDEATVIQGEPWSGLEGVATGGCSSTSGGYAGLCEVPFILMDDEKENIWMMEGGAQSSPAFDLIKKTLRLHRR